ncbi:MAG: KOW domain-containing RNA-binding protein [Oscillospiraceae bacterium]|jgi:ribosomal protein L14E/L6E/L27E|nr:KOW domain-containing RNA-binding protein [Oscillospiraceae bacterium]
MTTARRVAGYSIEPGRVALSRAGHDAGCYFMVMDVLPAGYALLADGRLRKVASPKKKKFRHIRPQPDRFDDLVEMARSGTLLDAHVRSRLARAGYAAGKEEEILGQERQY